MPVARGRRKRAESRYVARAARLAAQLRERRESQGISQERLAADAGVGLSTIRKIETGAVVEPGYFTVMAITSALGISPTELAEPASADLEGS